MLSNSFDRSNAHCHAKSPKCPLKKPCHKIQEMSDIFLFLRFAISNIYIWNCTRLSYNQLELHLIASNNLRTIVNSTESGFLCDTYSHDISFTVQNILRPFLPLRFCIFVRHEYLILIHINNTNMSFHYCVCVSTRIYAFQKVEICLSYKLSLRFYDVSCQENKVFLVPGDHKTLSS